MRAVRNHDLLCLRQQQGLALPVVLWIFLLLSLMFAGFSYAVRTETAITTQLVNTSKTKSAANAGLQLAVQRLLQQKEERLDDHIIEVPDEFNGVKLQVSIVNESGRIDLNQASEELLIMLFQNHVSSDEELYTVVDSLLDWRDDEVNNREFETVNDLMQIKGMTIDLMNAVRPMVTVYSGENRVTPHLSPPNLLQLLSGQPQETLETLRRQIHNSPVNEVAELLANTPQHLISDKMGDVYTIEVEARLQGDAKTRLSAVIKLVEGQYKPYTTLSLKELEKLDFIQ